MLPLTKRQREILDYLNEFIQQNGYAPSLEEIGRRFGLSSLATVHKHLTNLQEKGCIKRAWNRSRSVEMVPTRTGGRAVELPMLGYVAAGSPIEAVAPGITTVVPAPIILPLQPPSISECEMSSSPAPSNHAAPMSRSPSVETLLAPVSVRLPPSLSRTRAFGP